MEEADADADAAALAIATSHQPKLWACRGKRKGQSIVEYAQ